MRDSRQVTADSSQETTGGSASASLASSCRLSAVGWVGVGDRGNRRIVRTLAPMLIAALLCSLAGRGVAEAQYLAVFVDGRILAVTGARVVGDSRFHLDLPGGGSLEVPLARIDRVISDDVEPKPAPVPPAVCRPDYVEHALGPAVPFAREIDDAAKAGKLHPLLVLAVVRAESDFKPWAVSRVGACGLMQLMPSVWLEQGLTDPYDPAANLRAGCRHLRALLDRFTDVGTALAAYNAGVATVEKSGGMPPYRETREFVRKVLGQFCPAPGSVPEVSAVAGGKPI